MIPASRATASASPLGTPSPAQQLDHLGRDQHPAGRGRRPRGDVLAGHVDHPGGAGLVDVGEPAARQSAIRTPRRAASTCTVLARGAPRSRPRGTTISALDVGQVADQVRAVRRRPGETSAPPRSTTYAPRTNCRRPRASESPWVSRARAAGRRVRRRPISLRSAGQHEHLEGDVRRHRVAGSVKIGVSSSPTRRSPAACRAASRPPPNQTVPSGAQRLLDHVVVALADAAAGDHEVGADQLVAAARRGTRAGSSGTMPTR